jgi:hypothetical protein
VLALSLLATGASLGCGSSGSSQVTLPPVSAAGVNHISGFTPSGPVPAGKPVQVSFTIVQPNGKPLTQYATGPGPHTGVHLIFVRKDLADIVHLHPPIGPDGKISETVTLPAPGPWMLLTDVYEKQSGTSIPLNYQLKQDLQVTGHYAPKPLGPVRTSVTTDGYTFTIHRMPKLKVANADYLNVSVTDANGKPATFTPWFGALAHAVFFRQGNLAYFHTHICGPNLPLCAANSAIAGSSTKLGQLKIGMVFPQAGKWRLFLQGQIGDKIVTAPFSLDVQS